MSPFRLVEYGPGPVTFPRVYPTVDDAATAAEHLLAALEHRPHRRPTRVEIIDIWTREVVTRVTPYTDRDPDTCVACGQPTDPFAAVLPWGDLPGGDPPTTSFADGGTDGPGDAFSSPQKRGHVPRPPGPGGGGGSG